MGSFRLRLACLSLLLFVGCDDAPSGDDARLHGSSDGGTNATVDASAPCGSFTGSAGRTYPEEAGRYFELEHGGLVRQFKVHVPRGYRNGTPMPVLYAFHGMTGNAESFGIAGTGLPTKADSAAFLLVLPNGYQSSWNAGSCCGQAQKQGVDDVGFVRAVHAQLRDELGLCIDRTRVYATGYSNGGFLAYRLACQASDLFASVASVSGTMAFPYADCGEDLARPMPFLEIHGALDKITPLLGSNGRGAIPSLATLAGLNGCSTSSASALVPSSRLDTTCTTYAGCASGSEVTLCEASNGGHCWFGSATCGTGSDFSWFLGGNATGIAATEAVWSFVSRFRCETCGR